MEWNEAQRAYLEATYDADDAAEAVEGGPINYAGDHELELLALSPRFLRGPMARELGVVDTVRRARTAAANAGRDHEADVLVDTWLEFLVDNATADDLRRAFRESEEGAPDLGLAT